MILEADLERKRRNFRVAIVNVCNLNCFFCHNEAMVNPRRPGEDPNGKVGPVHISLDELLGIINAFTSRGGGQVNITGGEPLAHREIVRFLEDIDKRSTRVVLDTNVILADRLLNRPRIGNLDSIYASLHTTDGEIFRDQLGGRSISKVMDNIVALETHGYDVQINYSLGDYNKEEFGEGIYGLRVGIDGLWKPWLLRHERFRSVTQEESYESQILTIIDEMIGSWENARFLTGVPA